MSRALLYRHTNAPGKLPDAFIIRFYSPRWAAMAASALS